MQMIWCIKAGVPPFTAWKSQWTTKNVQVPRVGDYVQEGTYRYLVLAVTWNYSIDTVFINVERSTEWKFG